jgi:hypothetical protein
MASLAWGDGMRRTNRILLVEMEHCAKGQTLRDLLFQLYWQEDLNMTVIATRLGVPLSTLKYWMRRLELNPDRFAKRYAKEIAI